MIHRTTTLESQVLQLIDEYEKEVGLCVYGFDFTHERPTFGRSTSRTIQVQADVRLMQY